MTYTLPTEVVAADRRLQRSADDLMQLRWHWTLDEANSDRVGFSAYAREVGVSEGAVRNAAHAWADYVRSDSYAGVRTPGAPQTPDDFRELRKLSGDRQEAAKAIASVTGVPVGNVAKHKRDEVDAVVSTARERAVDRGTTVEHEIERAADWRAKARKAAEREQDEKKKAHGLRYIEIEGHVGAAMQRLRKILDAADDVQFTDEERELLTESLGKMRALLNLIDLRIAGETNIDWDAEFEKLAN